MTNYHALLGMGIVRFSEYEVEQLLSVRKYVFRTVQDNVQTETDL
jgi:hypothetical protein